MSSQLDRLALNTYIHHMVDNEQAALSEQDLQAMLDRGRQWHLGETLRQGGSIIFPHAGIQDCGHQIAATAQACLDSGADRVLVVGVLHALTDELQDARVRVANGADVTQEKYWGIQGPGLDSHDNWRGEFSLLHFLLLWDAEVKRRGVKAPELILRYPYLAGGTPESLPGIQELQAIARDAVIVSTADAFHHGIGYGEPPETALYPEQGGLDLAQRTILEGQAILARGDYWGYNQHCVTAKSDGRDAGQVVRYLMGRPFEAEVLDLTYTDTTDMYNSPPPTWVAGALVEQRVISA
ncbi:MAG: hypothetical protein KIT87_29590 [Anaerolineae bacterium]|nr:hypothetical protein [Anaerolineae bacterium]